MRLRLSKLFVALVVLCLIACCIFAQEVAAEEDNYAPELISFRLAQSSIAAGEAIRIELEIKEDATGLSRVFVQLNNTNQDDYMLTTEKLYDAPQFSSGEDYIKILLEVPTNQYTKDGAWHIGYIELYDQKGNFSRYCGVPGRDQLHSEFVEPQQFVNGVINIEITGSLGQFERPELLSVSIRNPLVEKPGTLILDLSFFKCSGISYIQIDLQNKNTKDFWNEQQHGVSQTETDGAYVIEIPISEYRHVGECEIVAIYVTDNYGNQAQYTSNYIEGHFVDYYDTAKEFDLLEFEVSGVKGDETAPAITDIRVLNTDAQVDKPGMLYFEIDLVEDGSGVACIDIEYECTDGSTIDVNSRGIYRFCVANYFEQALDQTILEKPLKTGTYSWRIPIPSTRPNGTYEIHVRFVRDVSENTYEDYSDIGKKAYFSVKDEFTYSFEMAITNGDLLATVQAMNEGEIGRILLSNRREDNVLTKDVLDAIADQNKTLVCYMDGFQWIFNGLKVKENKTKDLNLTTRIFAVEGHKLSSGKTAICLSFENNGKLPGIIEFRFKSAFVREYYSREDSLRLYHVEGESGGAESDLDYRHCGYTEIPHKDANIKVVLDDGDSWCYVKLSHNSKYIVSGEVLTKLNDSQIGNQTNPTITAPTVGGDQNAGDHPSGTTNATTPTATTVPHQENTQPTMVTTPPTHQMTTIGMSTLPTQNPVSSQNQANTTKNGITGGQEESSDTDGDLILYCVIAGAVILVLGFVLSNKSARVFIKSLMKRPGKSN